MNKKLSTLVIVAGAAVLLVILFGNSMFFTLKPGERAVVFRQFSSEPLDKENLLSPGFHIVAPWNQIYIYEVKEQKIEETMDVLDKNGLSLTIEISVRYNPVFLQIGDLHETFGSEYVSRLIIPEVRSAVRKVTGRYNAEEIYSTKRKEVEDAIWEETKVQLNQNYIDMRALLIRSINLPNDIKQAIEHKLTVEQESLAMRFRNEKERLEAERKGIEAEGIANFNRIINSSLTENILKQRGIEATIKLAESPNAKVVVVGSGKDGLPLILGGGK
jgi:regulator of protease activity HflC (stomatin/prohibitin superfamily)